MNITGIDLLMTALAEPKKLLTYVLIGVCRRHTPSVVLPFACTYGANVPTLRDERLKRNVCKCSTRLDPTNPY